MFNNMWDVKEPKHYSKRVGREVPGVVAVLCVVNTGPMLIAVTTITEMVILYKYVEIIIIRPVKAGCVVDYVEKKCERVQHLVCRCEKLAQKENERRHDNVAKKVHWDFCKKNGLEHTEK